MSWTLRGRTTAYDNIAKGSTAGRERTIRGTSLTTELIGAGSNILKGTSYHTSGQAENRFKGQTTFGGGEHLTST